MESPKKEFFKAPKMKQSIINNQPTNHPTTTMAKTHA
jgi:hypothetical protein